VTTTSATTRLFLVRHGEATTNERGIVSGWSDAPLTPRGRWQAERVAAALATAGGADALYCSPLVRAFETAAVIGAALGLEPVPVPELREIDVGDADGRRDADLLAQHPELARQSDEDGLDVPWPGGESQCQLRHRVSDAVRELLRRHAGHTILIVAHGGPLGWTVTDLLADPRPGFPDWRHNNGGLTELVVCGDSAASPATLVRHNDCAHLHSA
jgi:broad specificity phosphatase PhoE